MKIDDFTNIIQNVCNDETKGVLIIRMTTNDEFYVEDFGELTYLEKVGLLATAKHDILQMPHSEHLKDQLGLS
jgi:hypothetical protein